MKQIAAFIVPLACCKECGELFINVADAKAHRKGNRCLTPRELVDDQGLTIVKLGNQVEAWNRQENLAPA